MEPVKHPPFFPILVTAILFGLLGWGGWIFTILTADPELGPRWLFYFCLTLAVSGTALPVVAFLNRRFPTAPVAGEGILLRQAVWVGVYASLVVWLQSGRILNPLMAVFLAVCLALIESLLRLNERSRFNPGKGVEHE